MSEILYHDNDMTIKFKPTSQLYPYVHVILRDEDDGGESSCDFLSSDVLAEIGNAFILASKRIRDHVKEQNENS